MRERPLRFACLGLLLLLLAGCATPKANHPGATGDGASSAPNPSNPQASIAMGRYIEQPIADVTLPETPSGTILRQGGDGACYAISNDGATFTASEDMVAWSERPTGYTPPEGYEIEDFAVAADGTAYFLATRFANGAFTSSLRRVAGGEATDVEIPRVGGAAPRLYAIKLLPSGNLLVRTREQGILQIAPDGALVRQYQVAGSYEDFDASADELAVLALEDRAIVYIGLDDGAERRRQPLPDAAAHTAFLRYDAEGALLYADGTGIYRQTTGGSLLERIVDGALGTLSDPTAFADRMFFDARGRMVIPFGRFPQTQLIAYAYDDAVPTEPSTALNLYSLRDSYALQKAVLTFQNAHPDVMIRWTVALKEEASITADDALRTLNTEVLAGKGPDLFVLDGLPVASYIEKGVLADLSDIVQPMIDAGDVFVPIIDAYARDGKRCAVPTRFSLDALFGDVQGVRTLEDLASRARGIPDKPPFADMSPESLLRTFYRASYPAWKDDAGRLRADAVEAFLEQIAAIIGDWTPERARAAMPEDAQGSEDLALLAKGFVAMAAHTLQGARSLSDGMGTLDEARTGGYVAMPGQAEGVFEPSLLLGVNAGGARVDLCTSFVEMVLGEELQGMDIYGDCFPVRKASFDAMLANEQRTLKGMVGVGGGGAYYNYAIAPGDAMVAWARSMADAAKSCSPNDETLVGMLIEETKGFFAGQGTAAQAAGAFVNRANAYLTE